MAVILLTEEEYQNVVKMQKDLTEQAKAATPRAATHLRRAAKLHSDFLALESGKRATSKERADAKAEREAEKFQRQQARLNALQQKMQQSKSAASAQATGNPRQGRTNASAPA